MENSKFIAIFNIKEEINGYFKLLMENGEFKN